MSNFTSPLNSIKIASPCSADWNAMVGNERQKYCGDCKLNVYNLSGMTRQEAENFLMQAEGRVCVRYFKRADGTVLTQDCPVGWKAVRQRVSKTAAAFASLIFAALSSFGLASYFAKTKIESPTMGTITSKTINPEMGEFAVDENSNTPTMGKPQFVMGAMAAPQYTEGKVSNLRKVKSQIAKQNNR